MSIISDYISDIVDAVAGVASNDIDISDLTGLESISGGIDGNILEGLSEDEIDSLGELYDVSDDFDFSAENASHNHEISFTGNTYLGHNEKYWDEEAAKEYAKHGETTYYKRLMENAAKAHADVDHNR